MTVSSTTNKHSYNGNGSQAAFAYTFKVFADADIKVYVGTALQSLNTHYTLSGVGSSSGGNVTFTSGNLPASGTGNVTLLRSLALTQGVDLINYGKFDAEVVEAQYDKLTMMVQQLQEQADRTIRFSTTVSDAGGVEITDTVAQRSGKVLAYDANGDLSVANELGDWQGNWSTASVYAVRDLVLDAATNNVYTCLVGHTAGTLASDVTASKWALVINASAVAASATAAANSATAAASSATTATTQASTSTTKASEASTSASNASTSETNAASSASTASTKASQASTSASNASTSETNAATSASNASTSTSTATTQASTATTKASQASTSATNSASSATASASSASTATTQASTATTQASNAASSASSASGSASTATTQASTATTQASTATTKASEASVSAAAALVSENNTANKLPLAGGTMTGDLELGDNVKAKFGAGDDLQIYHSGGHSYVRDEGTGGLILTSNGPAIYIQKGDSETIAEFGVDGAVKLRHDNSQKLATTSTGVDVTGTVTADGLVVDGSTTGQINGTDYTFSGTNYDVHMLVGTSGGGVRLGEDSVTNASVIGTTGANNLEIVTYDGSNWNKSLRVSNNRDISFYEDTGTTAKFHWDASAESLGIGTSSPSAKLGINAAAPDFTLLQSDAVKYRMGVSNVTNGGVTGSASGDYFSRTSGGKMLFSTNDGVTPHAVIDSSGNVGIGTSSPSNFLSVRDGMQVGEAYQAAAATGIASNYCASFGRSAGRSIHAMGSIDIQSGYGVEFGTGGSANTLDDYETGTFTPTVAGVTLTTGTGTYTKIGNVVYIGMFLNWPTTTDATGVAIAGLPFTCKADNNSRAGLTLSYSTRTTHTDFLVSTNTTFGHLRNLGGSVPTNADMSTRVIHVGGTYQSV